MALPSMLWHSAMACDNMLKIFNIILFDNKRDRLNRNFVREKLSKNRDRDQGSGE